MSWRRALLLIAALLALAAGGGGFGDALDGRGSAPDRGATATEGRVTRIVDGDTIRVNLAGGEEPVRYIGVDTPETKKPGTPVQCFGKAASAYNEHLLRGRRVRLTFDVEQRDRYGRLLAYVHRLPDDLFVNARLVSGGYASTLTIPPNVAHAEQFRRLAGRARRARVGLWKACPTR